MDSALVQRQINELNATRSKTRLLRLLFTLLTFGIVATSLALIVSAVRGLAQPGPAQEEFSQQLSTKLQQNVVPRVQTIAAQTLTELRPEVEQSFFKLNQRTPELSSAALRELETLSTNVTKSGEATLQKTFGQMLAKREEKVRAMFPGTTDAQIQTMLTNVSNEAQDRILSSQKLLSPHMNTMNNIVGNITIIQSQEKVDPKSRNADWELISNVIDVVQSEMPVVSNAAISSGATKPVTATKAATTQKSGAMMSKPANKPAAKQGGANNGTAQRGY